MTRADYVPRALVGLMLVCGQFPPAIANPLAPGATLCLHAVSIPTSGVSGTEERRLGLEKRLIEALGAASFEVADPPRVAEVIKRVDESTGGLIDPVTGYRDEARYQKYVRDRGAALREELGCDGQLYAQVVVVRAFYNGSAAVWDGTEDAVASTGRRILNALGGRVETGWVSALSLWLSVFDLDDKDVAFRSAGIEALVDLAVLRDQDLLPEDAWLTDIAKLDAAIASALGSEGESLRNLGTAGTRPTPKMRPPIEDERRGSRVLGDG